MFYGESDNNLNNVSLSEVVDIDRWQKLQDHFAEVIGTAIRTVDLEGKQLTIPSRMTRFCQEIIGSSSAGAERCGMCIPTQASDMELEKGYKTFSCHLGLHNLSIPVLVTNKIVAARMLVGPVILGRRKDASEYLQEATELGIDIEEFMDGLREIKVFSFSRFESVAKLLRDVSRCITQLGYQKMRLAKIVPDVLTINKAIHSFYLDKVLNTLLEVASYATGAEFGSVMLFNRDSGILTIKVATGLEEKVIKDTRLKLGEGIAGIVAENRQSLLLDDMVEDSRVKVRLKRPQIKSAIVAPLQLENGELFGILNISTRRARDLLTPISMELVNQLIKLASVALTSITAKNEESG